MRRGEGGGGGGRVRRRSQGRRRRTRTRTRRGGGEVEAPFAPTYSVLLLSYFPSLLLAPLSLI